MTTVVNIRRDSCDVYIGRGSAFGNQFTYLTNVKNPATTHFVENRAVAIAEFKKYFLKRISSDIAFRNKVLALKDKKLGCYCKPLPCHGDVIKEWLDSSSSS